MLYSFRGLGCSSPLDVLSGYAQDDAGLPRHKDTGQVPVEVNVDKVGNAQGRTQPKFERHRELHVERLPPSLAARLDHALRRARWQCQQSVHLHWVVERVQHLLIAVPSASCIRIPPNQNLLEETVDLLDLSVGEYAAVTRELRHGPGDLGDVRRDPDPVPINE